MVLKIRYASSLLLVVLLLALFTWAIVYCLTRQYYLTTTVLLALLYLVTFQVGKRLSKVFFTLSFIQHIKKNGGIVYRNECQSFIRNSVGKRRIAQDVDTLALDILDTLVQEKIIEILDDKILLIAP